MALSRVVLGVGESRLVLGTLATPICVRKRDVRRVVGIVVVVVSRPDDRRRSHSHRSGTRTALRV
jgi:hypothetical protein